jgi:hypothetical protein
MLRRILVIALGGVFLAVLGLGCGSEGAMPKATTSAKAPDKKEPGSAGGRKSASD